MLFLFSDYQMHQPANEIIVYAQTIPLNVLFKKPTLTVFVSYLRNKETQQKDI